MGKEIDQKIGMNAIGPVKMKQHSNPKAGMNGKEISTMKMDTSQEKERKVRTEKEEEKKIMDVEIKEKDQVVGKATQIM